MFLALSFPSSLSVSISISVSKEDGSLEVASNHNYPNSAYNQKTFNIQCIQ